jgi:hypothetical protein|tara:strand:+ start:250 stop:498 length:249 start_codon:yes stop_codon:yes gene_type:complete
MLEYRKIASKRNIKNKAEGGNNIAEKEIHNEASNILLILCFPDFKLIALLIPSKTKKCAKIISDKRILLNKNPTKIIKAIIG